MGEFWSIVYGVGTIISVIAVTVYATKRNTSNIDNLKNNEIKDLYEKYNKKMDEDKARETFVTKELYNNQMVHIDTIFIEIKEQNKEILGYLRK